MGKVTPKDPTGRTVMLTGVRLSFAETLYKKGKPKKAEADSRETHSANFIIEADSKDFASNQAAIVSALKACSIEFKKAEMWWKQLFDDDPKQICFRKGSRFKNDAGEIYAGYDGNLVVVAKGPRAGEERPRTLWDRHKRDVAEKDILDVFYNGTYCDAAIAFYATDTGGTNRITCSIEAIRSHQEGERMGGGGISVDSDDFDDLPDDNDDFGAGIGGTPSDNGDLTGGGTSSGAVDLLG